MIKVVSDMKCIPPGNKKPHKPLSNLSFEATRQIDSGRHKEWGKYVIGWAA